MGIRRGSFEGVSLSSQVERAVEHSTIRPDEGTPLRIGAQALDSWADAFGKMANLASKMKAKKDANAGIQSACESASREADRAYRDYISQPEETRDSKIEAGLKTSMEQAGARYRASKTLGVFSGDFDMERDWVAWEQREAQKAKAKENGKGWFSW